MPKPRIALEFNRNARTSESLGRKLAKLKRDSVIGGS
jgi:hypothetical protein